MFVTSLARAKRRLHREMCSVTGTVKVLIFSGDLETESHLVPVLHRRVDACSGGELIPDLDG